MAEQTEIENLTNLTPKKESLLKALEANLGNITLATKACGMSRQTFYDYCNTDAKFKAKVDAINEVALDFAESSLFRQIKEGDTTATIFYLKTKGKNRGYIERQEITPVMEMPDFTITKQ